MDDKLLKEMKKFYEQLKQIGVEHLTFGCFIDNKGNLEKCRHNNFDFRNEKDTRCCPFYRHKCIDSLDAVIRDVYGENNYRIV